MAIRITLFLTVLFLDWIVAHFCHRDQRLLVWCNWSIVAADLSPEFSVNVLLSEGRKFEEFDDLSQECRRRHGCCQRIGAGLLDNLLSPARI
jgi:hypothetical protein